MNCGKSRREDCSEECAGGNSEEELEEYSEIFENLEDYRRDAKKNRPLGKDEDSDSDTDTDSDDETGSDDDDDDDDDDEESDTDSDDDDDDDDDEEEEEEKEESGTLKTLQNKAKSLLNAKHTNEKTKKSKHHN